MLKKILILNLLCFNFILLSMDREDKHKVAQDIIAKIKDIFPNFEQLSEVTKNNIANYFNKIDFYFRKIKNSDNAYNPHLDIKEIALKFKDIQNWPLLSILYEKNLVDAWENRIFADLIQNRKQFKSDNVLSIVAEVIDIQILILSYLNGFEYSSTIASVCKVSPDKKFLISGSKDGIKLYDAQGNLQQLPKINNFSALFQTNNDLFLACTNLNKGHTGVVQNLAFSGDKFLASSSGQEVKIWDLDNGNCIKTLIGHNSGKITSIVYSPDGKYLATACEQDAHIKIWDTKTFYYETTDHQSNFGEIIFKDRMPSFLFTWHFPGILSIAYSCDGRFIYYIFVDCLKMTGILSLKVWDTHIKCCITLFNFKIDKKQITKSAIHALSDGSFALIKNNETLVYNNQGLQLLNLMIDPNFKSQSS